MSVYNNVCAACSCYVVLVYLALQYTRYDAGFYMLDDFEPSATLDAVTSATKRSDRPKSARPASAVSRATGAHSRRDSKEAAAKGAMPRWVDVAAPDMPARISGSVVLHPGNVIRMLRPQSAKVSRK
jgi:hypothetical protein